MQFISQQPGNSILHTINQGGLLQQLTAAERACLAAQIIMADHAEADDVLHKVINHCDASLFKLVEQQNSLPVF